MQFVVLQPTPAASRWTSRIALFSLIVLVTAFFLHRLFGMPTVVALNLVKLAYAGIGVALLLGAAAAIGIWRNGGMGTARVVFSLGVSLVMLAGPLVLAMLARDFPPINDLTTDTSAPPEFEMLGRMRGPGANSAVYPGETFAKRQAHAYPDLRPMLLDRSSEEAFELVAEAVRRLKMDIIREEAPSDEVGHTGIIEAVDRTLVLGFYDDVAIRVGGDDKRARIDIRSASRFGSNDLGRNAERIRALMREIVVRLEVMVPTADGDRAQSSKHPSRPLLKREKDGDPKSADPDKSRDRARLDARREQEQKGKPPSKDDRRYRDKRPGQSFE
jgi:uncharacterized protein (DUF1499 family)